MLTRHVLYLAAAIAVLTGCKERADHQPTYSEPEYTKLYRTDLATIVVSLSETNVATSGSVRLMIDARAPADVPIEIPDITPSIESFTIVQGYAEPTQPLPNGHLLRRRVWELAPGLPGRVTFQPIEIPAAGQTLRIEPIPITVRSVLPADVEGVEIRDISAPVPLLPAQEKKRRSLYTVLGALFILGLIPIIPRLIKRAASQPEATPYDVAITALDHLPAQRVERIHALSHIFRAYHEARFHIPMLGQTAAELAPVIEAEETLRFLEQCDAARFSNTVPEPFAAEAEQFVRDYIAQTNEEVECG